MHTHVTILAISLTLLSFFFERERESQNQFERGKWGTCSSNLHLFGKQLFWHIFKPLPCSLFGQRWQCGESNVCVQLWKTKYFPTPFQCNPAHVCSEAHGALCARGLASHWSVCRDASLKETSVQHPSHIIVRHGTIAQNLWNFALGIKYSWDHVPKIAEAKFQLRLFSHFSKS